MSPRPVLHLLLLLALAGCGTLGGTSELLPTVVLQGGNASTAAPAVRAGRQVTASGVIVPARQATLAFTLGGSVRSVQAELGDKVRAGQVLVELENTALAAQADTARRTLRELTSPAAMAAAEQTLANARDALKDSEYRRTVQQEGFRASPETIRAAEAKLLLAQEEVDRYKGRYDQASGDADKAQALVNLNAAQQRRDAALRNLNWFRGKPSENDQAILNAEVAIAQAAVQEAEWYLAAVKGEAVPAEASGAQLLQLENARDQLAAAEAALAGSRLTAPFDGTLAALKVDLGDYVQPGVPAAIVADLSRLRVETTDLSELDVVEVSIGAVCTVSIEALSDQADGRVIRVAQLPTILGGDVVYAATIELDSIPQGLRAGMSAEVSCEAP
ncbi:MAG: HlyD family efflux transporter periplasmic adaptor subunit [Chloroflexi bacterium]|nr:HlyD family efflux transporter periplasmic adaptor subunit [Chloroflexota bacterium]